MATKGLSDANGRSYKPFSLLLSTLINVTLTETHEVLFDLKLLGYGIIIECHKL